MSLSSYNGENSFTIKGKTYLKRGGDNIYDIVNAAGTSGNFSTGWVQTDGTTTVANGAKMQFDHNLGTSDIVVDVWAADDINGTNNNRLSYSGHDTGATIRYGAAVHGATSSTVGVVLGTYGYIDEQGDLSQAPTGVHQFTGKYIKVVVSAGAGGSGNGFIFSARSEGSAPLLIDDRVIYATQIHDNANHMAIRVADKATGEILQSQLNGGQNWPQHGTTAASAGYRANGIVDWKNATGSSVDIYYFHGVSWVAKATFNRTTQTLGNIEAFGVHAAGTNFFDYNWQPAAVIDNGSNKEFLSAYALANSTWNQMRDYNLSKMEYRQISSSYNIPDYTGVYQKLPDLMDIAKSTNGDFMVGPGLATSYHLLAGVNPINGKFYTYGMGNGVLNIFKMTGSYSDWGARLYELTDSPQPTSTAGIEHQKAIQLGSHGTYSRYHFISVQFDEHGNETGISFGALLDDSYRRNELIYIIPWNSKW